MGCLHSKNESSDLHPNVFRVVNIDEHGADLCSGQLEITEANIVLYRERRESTVWPLHSLRRYGFEGEIFSFESGRRCETGEGIYAFKCRRATLLFRALQNQIQLRNIIHDSAPYPVSRMNPSPQGRQTLQASVVHRSSIDNGQPDSLRSVANSLSVYGQATGERNANQTLRSPSSADILEVMPLYLQSQASNNHASNVYQLRDFKREHNNNQGDLSTDPVHLYSNDFNRDLAMLRNTLKQEAGLFQIKDAEDEAYFQESRYANTNISNNQQRSLLSPTLSSTSEHYAQLSLEQQESARYYINIKLDKSMQDIKRNDMAPSTPPTPGGKQVEYCNLTLSSKQDVNTYANLSLGDLGDNIRNGKQGLSFPSEHCQKFSESDTFASMSPIEELEVNYAVLDIDANKEGVKIPKEIVSSPSQSYSSPKTESIASCSAQRNSYLVSQCSVDKTSTSIETAPTAKNGYTTIDFDKTVALTSVAADADVESDGPRKTRHNSCTIIVTGSPSSGEKNKNNN